MRITRRTTLKFGMAGLAAIGSTSLMPFIARAAGMGDEYATDGGKIVINPVQHASFVMQVPGDRVIYNDPVGGADLYGDHPRPDLILITHEHGDHFDVPTLQALVGDETRLIANPSVFDKLPDDLKAKASSIANGANTTFGDITIDAIPAYNTTEDRKQFHPQGRDNGYVLSIDGRKVYIAGDTEDILEMRALTGIHIAFLPMNLPYTMDIEQAASAVAAFKPETVYPYHYKGQDPEAFAKKVAEAANGTKVVQGGWYS